MTRRVAIAIWILGLVVVGAPHPALAADYYIIRSGDMLYRVPHSAHRTFFDNGIANKKRDVVPHSTETRHKKKPNKAQKHSLPKQAQMIYVFAKVGDELHHLPCTYRGNGEVSYYGREFHGKPMKNGGIFNKNKLTAAYYDKQMVGKVLFIEVDKEGLQQRRYRGWRISVGQPSSRRPAITRLTMGLLLHPG